MAAVGVGRGKGYTEGKGDIDVGNARVRVVRNELGTGESGDH